MNKLSKRKLKTKENLNKLKELISIYKRRRRDYDIMLDFADKEHKKKPKPSIVPKSYAITEEEAENHVLSRYRQEVEKITSEIIELLQVANQP